MVSLIFIVARVAFLVAASILFAIVLTAYLRLRSRRMLFVTIGFGLFFVHGLISIPEIVNRAYNMDFSDSFHLIVDLAGLIFILLGTVQDVVFKKTQDTSENV